MGHWSNTWMKVLLSLISKPVFKTTIKKEQDKINGPFFSMVTYRFLWNSRCTESNTVKVFSMKDIRRKTTNFSNPVKVYHYYTYSLICCLKLIYLLHSKIKKTKPFCRNTVLSHQKNTVSNTLNIWNFFSFTTITTEDF